MKPNLLIAFVFAALTGMAHSETVSGPLVQRDEKNISLKVGGHERSFLCNDSTKYLDMAGAENPRFGASDFPLWSRSGMKITIVTADGKVANSVQLPIKLVSRSTSASPTPGLPTGVNVGLRPGGAEKMKGQKLPPFKMKSVGGKSLSSQDTKGKVVVIDFWATWCTPCAKLTPVMQRIHERYASKGVVVIGASTIEQGDPNKLIVSYAKTHQASYPMTYDNDAFARSVGVMAIPCVMIVDQKGVVQKVFVGFGPKTAPGIEAAVKALLPR